MVCLLKCCNILVLTCFLVFSLFTPSLKALQRYNAAGKLLNANGRLSKYDAICSFVNICRLIGTSMFTVCLYIANRIIRMSLSKQ